MRLSKLNPAFLPASVLACALLSANAHADPGTANGIVMNAELADAVPTLSIFKTLRLSHPTAHFTVDYLGRPLRITGWENIQDGDTRPANEIDPRRLRCDLSLSSYGNFVENFDLIQGWASFGSSQLAPAGQIHRKLGAPCHIYTGTFPLEDVDPKTGAVDPAGTHPSGASYVTFECYKPISSGDGISMGEIRAAIGPKNFDIDMVSPFFEPLPYVEPLDALIPATKPQAGPRAPGKPTAPAAPSVVVPPVAPPVAPPVTPPAAPETPVAPAPAPQPAPQPPVAPAPAPAPQPAPQPRVPRYNPPTVPTSVPRGPHYNPPGGGNRPPRPMPPARLPR